MIRHSMVWSVVIVVVWALPAWAQHEHHDVAVGHTESGVLAAHFAWEEVHALPAVNGLLHGWAGDHPGFAHLEEDEPGEDMYTLQQGAAVMLEVVAFDDAFNAWAGGLAQMLHDPGDTYLLGDEHLHTHLDWHIDADDPLFDPGQESWQAQFRLVDTGTTGYAPSEVYTMTFTTPEPATLSFTLLGAVLLRRRGR